MIDSQAPRLEEELGKVIGQGAQGFAFAVIAVFLFLLQLRPRPFAGIANAIRPTIIIALSIPLSVMVTMLVMALLDWPMNFMSLAGLAIAVGRIVDDSIVVLENIYRHIQEGSPRAVAVIATPPRRSARTGRRVHPDHRGRIRSPGISSPEWWGNSSPPSPRPSAFPCWRPPWWP